VRLISNQEFTIGTIADNHKRKYSDERLNYNIQAIKKRNIYSFRLLCRGIFNEHRFNHPLQNTLVRSVYPTGICHFYCSIFLSTGYSG
jgi:hypothetical protein